MQRIPLIVIDFQRPKNNKLQSITNVIDWNQFRDLNRLKLLHVNLIIWLFSQWNKIDYNRRFFDYFFAWVVTNEIGA